MEISVLALTKFLRLCIITQAVYRRKSYNRTKELTRRDCWEVKILRQLRVLFPNTRLSRLSSRILSSKCATLSISNQIKIWRECTACRSTRIKFWIGSSCRKKWLNKGSSNLEPILMARRAYWQMMVIMVWSTDTSLSETRATTSRPSLTIWFIRLIRQMFQDPKMSGIPWISTTLQWIMIA